MTAPGRDLIALLLLGSVLGASPGAASRVVVTVADLFARGHRLEIVSGTEVVWADAHLDRVWFPAGSGAPRVERVQGGFRAVFGTPGTYRGVFAVAGAHGSDSVYDLVVVVREPAR